MPVIAVESGVFEKAALMKAGRVVASLEEIDPKQFALAD